MEVTCVVGNATGLHARPATLFVQCVQRFPQAQVFLRHGAKEVNARSLLSVLSLGAGPGASILIRAEGPQAEEALSALSALVESGFGE